MLDFEKIAAAQRGAIVAPAGHGKTHLIANIASKSRRCLILTHTHAGVQAIRTRLARLEGPCRSAVVDTIAGWCMKYAYAFPGVAKPPLSMPTKSSEWEQLYAGALLALKVKAIRDVIAASYDKILIDEYQDCNRHQHALSISLSEIVSTLVFGDPMQGIFEFAGATLSWDGEIHDHFPLVANLDIPHRWSGKNEALGIWIAETRDKLIAEMPIDLGSAPITFIETSDDVSIFKGVEARTGTQAAIHCVKERCYTLAEKSSNGCGDFQAIEAVSLKCLETFAIAWDSSSGNESKVALIKGLVNKCVHKISTVSGEVYRADKQVLISEMGKLALLLDGVNGAASLLQIFGLARKRPDWVIFRNELWRDAELSVSELASGRCKTLHEGFQKVCQRVAFSGRTLPSRIVSTPLLLKGLEFDHVVIPDANHFVNQSSASAKLFYVAISRATRSLTISSSSRSIQFSKPNI